MSEEKDKAKPEELHKKIEELEKQKSEYLAGWQRARADFLNYKKEEIERIEEILKYGGEEFILKILPILDNFDLAERKLPEDLKNNKNIEGFLQIKTQILDFLKAQGVEEIKTMNEIFDPNLHEAAEEVEPSFVKATEGEESKLSSSPFAGVREGKEIKPGMIVEEVQKGYKINGRLLRPAKVKVVK